MSQLQVNSLLTLNVLAIGGSRHIGYHASLRFLEAGGTVTFLLRNPALFDSDEAIQKHVKEGRALLVKGDGLIKEDVQSAWNEASKQGPVDLLLFTLGYSGSPSFRPTQGFVINPANLVTQCLLNALCTMPKDQPNPPKVIFLTTIGATRSSRKTLGLFHKFLYGYLIQHPIRDKLACERILNHCSGWEWNSTTDGEPSEAITGPGWKELEGLPKPGSLANSTMVIRAAQLHDGPCLADSKENAYRVAVGEITGAAPSKISRKDVGHFIFETLTKPELWEKWGGKQISISY